MLISYLQSQFPLLFAVSSFRLQNLQACHAPSPNLGSCSTLSHVAGDMGPSQLPRLNMHLFPFAPFVSGLRRTLSAPFSPEARSFPHSAISAILMAAAMHTICKCTPFLHDKTSVQKVFSAPHSREGCMPCRKLLSSTPICVIGAFAARFFASRVPLGASLPRLRTSQYLGKNDETTRPSFRFVGPAYSVACLN